MKESERRMKVTSKLLSGEVPVSSNLKIGEVSRRSGVGIEALRFYERSGLLGKPMRTESGYRVYDKTVLDRLAFIKKAQLLGFSLNEIRHIIQESKAGASPCADVRQIVRERLAELDKRLRDLRRYRRELAATLADWDKKGADEGTICGLIESSGIESESIETTVPRRKHNTGKK